MAEELLRVAQSTELFVADPGGGKGCGEPFELGSNLVRLAHVAGARPAHERTAPRLHVDEATRLELAQRLAHRCPADAELGRERLLAQPRAGRDLAVQDPRLDRRRQRVDERLTVAGHA